MSGGFMLPASRFLDGSFTIAGLPAAAGNAQKYAWVTDLHDGQPDLVISDGTYWKPARPWAQRTVSNSNSNMTLTPLVNSPLQIMQGTLTAGRSVALDTANAYPGARFRIKREAGGLFNISILGLATINLGIGGGWADFDYTPAGWIQTASGGLL